MLAMATPQTTVRPFSLELKPASRKRNVVYGTHKQIYQDVSVVKALTKGKFPVYLVNSSVTKLDYAMKIFPYRNGQPHLYFRNESRFAGLRHPNLIKYLFFEPHREVIYDDNQTQISYIMMEYASNGSFTSFFKDYSEEIDDKLARTYFKQLISGLEYLHQSGIAHVDLKLDNLLLDQDFTLKIADFDLAHYHDDAIIISNGTKYFRAPELKLGRCNNTKAADIYSAGITLFTLKTKGVLPQFEDELIGPINFWDLLYNNPTKFWKYHSLIQSQGKITFDEDFKDLFNAMTKFDPQSRASFEEIKSSKWYNGPCYSDEELKEKMMSLFHKK